MNSKARNGFVSTPRGDRQVPRADRQVPSLQAFVYCIGAQKAGTSWLYSMLHRHPDCHLPPIKEVRYWDWPIDGPDRYASRAARKEVEQATRARLRSWRRPWTYAAAARRLDKAERYERLIRDAAEPGSVQAYLDYVLLEYRGQPVAVDITPNYQCLAAEDYAAMARLHPNARFVFLMRDPVERLWSGVRHALRDRIRSGAATGDEIRARFREALETPGHRDFRRTEYHITIAELEKAVAPERIHYVFYERLFEPREFDRLTGFIGLASRGMDAGHRVNVGGRSDLWPSTDAQEAARRRLAATYDDARRRFGADVPESWGRILGKPQGA